MAATSVMSRRLAVHRVLGAGLLLAGGPSSVAWAAAPGALGVRAGRPLHFPADFGAHPDTQIEWWYATGLLRTLPQQQVFGFQVTFFRSRTGLAASASRFQAEQLLFAHAAITDLSQKRLRHDQRIARQGFQRGQAREGDTGLRLADWQLHREDVPQGLSLYQTRLHSETARFGFELSLRATQPVLLQGQAGYSRKGPQAAQASHYYSQPQLAVQGALTVDGQRQEVSGRAWLDHEWSNGLLDERAVGWDWIGMNLEDGSALTAFRLRQADGTALWAGGSWRPAGAAVRDFGPQDVRFTPQSHWHSPRSQARYPVSFQVHTPVGDFEVRALLDDQELDSRQSTGSIYWEGLSECVDSAGRVIGHGYLEMTGYAGRLQIGAAAPVTSGSAAAG
ncbi:MAG: lipocalin-like domain-containing protein [Pseudomonadota bacterium]